MRATLRKAAVTGLGCLLPLAGLAGTTNATELLTNTSLPAAGPSFLRVLGALAVVIGLFLGGVWLFRNGNLLRLRGGRVGRLQVLESRSLGGRHALYVVGYDQERLLVASSPAGISLLTQLPQATAPAGELDATANGTFAETLARILKGQPAALGNRAGTK